MIAVSSCVTPLGPGVSAAHPSMHSAGPKKAMPYDTGPRVRTRHCCQLCQVSSDAQ